MYLQISAKYSESSMSALINFQLITVETILRLHHSLEMREDNAGLV